MDEDTIQEVIEEVADLLKANPHVPWHEYLREVLAHTHLGCPYDCAACRE